MVVSSFEVVEVVGSGEVMVSGSVELVLIVDCQVVEVVGSGEVLVPGSIEVVFTADCEVVQGDAGVGRPVGSWIPKEEFL